MGAVASASNRDRRAAIDEASRRSAAAAAGSTIATASRARLSWRCASRRQAFSSSCVASRVREVRGIGRRSRERRVEPRDQRPDVRRHVRRPLQRHAARCRDEIREELRRPLVHVLGTRDEGLEHRHRGHAAVAGHGLRPAGEARDTGEPSLLREVGGQLQVRVQARLQPPVGLEQEATADDGRAVRRVPAQRLLVGTKELRDGTLPRGPEPWRRPADQRRIGRARLSIARQGADGPTLRDDGREGAPGPVARDRLPYDAVANHHQDGVAVPAPVILTRRLVRPAPAQHRT